MPPQNLPLPARRNHGEAGTSSAARATRRPSLAAAGGGLAPVSAHARRYRRVVITARRARAVPAIFPKGFQNIDNIYGFSGLYFLLSEDY